MAKSLAYEEIFVADRQEQLFERVAIVRMTEDLNCLTRAHVRRESSEALRRSFLRICTGPSTAQHHKTAKDRYRTGRNAS